MKVSFRTFCTRLEIWKWMPKRQHYKKINKKNNNNKVKKVKFSKLWKTKRCLSSLSTMAFRFIAEDINLNCIFDRTTVRKIFYAFVSIENNLWENLIDHPIGWFCETIPEFAIQYLICLFQLQLFFILCYRQHWGDVCEWRKC